MICPNCGMQMPDGSARFCTCCGQPLDYAAPDPAQNQPDYSQQGMNYKTAPVYKQTPQDAYDPYAVPQPPLSPAPKKNTTMIVWLILGPILAAALVAVFFIWGLPAMRGKSKTSCPHEWLNATCEEPRTCALCGQTDGSSLGHSWSFQGCESPEVCTRCGTFGDIPGHNLTEASYDEPSYCVNCGEVFGNVKGYVGDAWLYWTSETIDTESINGVSGRPAVAELYEPIIGCRKLTINLSVDLREGNVIGLWGLYVRQTNGEWTDVNTFYVDSLNDSIEVYMEGLTFDAMAFNCQCLGDYWDFSYDVTITDVQVYDG